MDLDSALTGKPVEGATATDILRADHVEVMRLFSEYDGAGTSEHVRRVIARTVCLQLELHDRLERDVFYPAVKTLDPDRIGRSLTQHDELCEAIDAVKSGADDADAHNVHEAFERLKRLVESHVEEEERSLFPLVEARVGGELVGLGKRLIERKEELTGSTSSLEGPAT